MIDQPQAVRPGEELDPGRIEAYLASHLPDVTGPVRIEQFTRGFSNLTYLVQAGDRDLVLRRPPVGSTVKSAHDMKHKVTLLSALIGPYGRVPRPLAYCEDVSVLGAPFYVMERVHGVIFRDRASRGVDLGPAVMRRLSEATVDNLVAIHAVDYRAAGLDALGRGEGYVNRQISGWTQRYERARTDELADIENASSWLLSNLPPESGACLIHNDYKYDNLVLDPSDLSQIRAVLDWEMATIGDPLMDLGTSLGYWVQAGDPPDMQALPFVLTALPGNLTRDEVVQRYAEKSGRPVDSAVFYYVYGLFKIAVVAQQIYARYKMGHTHDPRFATLIDAIRILGRTAIKAAETMQLG